MRCRCKDLQCSNILCDYVFAWLLWQHREYLCLQNWWIAGDADCITYARSAWGNLCNSDGDENSEFQNGILERLRRLKWYRNRINYRFDDHNRSGRGNFYIVRIWEE